MSQIRKLKNDDEKGEPHHNWVDEVVRCEARNGSVAGSELMITSSIITRPPPEKKDPSLLTREEIEDPKVWAQICIQRMVELAKESSTMRRVLDPIFIFLDTKRQWIPRQSLSMTVLPDMCYFTDNTVNRQLILALLIHHLDHKNVSHDPKVKLNIIQIAIALVQQIRSEGVISDIGFVSDLCRHLRKSLQATVDSIGEQELNMNITLQNAIENCLLETAKGIIDARPLFDMMALTMEKLPSIRDVARSTIGSMIILAHTFSLVSFNLLSQQLQSLEESAESLRERSLKFYRGCRKYNLDQFGILFTMVSLTAPLAIPKACRQLMLTIDLLKGLKTCIFLD